MNPSSSTGQSRSAGPIVVARIARALRRLSPLRGWKGLVNRLVPEHSAPFLVHNGTSVFTGNLESFIDRQVYLFGGYEASLIERFFSCVPVDRRGTILDVGANVGTHSTAFAKAFESVHAFEPNPMLWSQFEQNMQLNHLVNVRLHKLGLADRDSELTLHLIEKANYGLGTFSTADQYDLPLRAVATCPIRHAGAYLSEVGAGRLDAVKIDVQGFEPEVLSGLVDVLIRDRPVIWCEIGPGTLTKMSTKTAIAKLIPYPFRCLRMELNAKWAKEIVSLREHTGELPPGDYVFAPIPD